LIAIVSQGGTSGDGWQSNHSGHVGSCSQPQPHAFEKGVVVPVQV
jgi:hypothetical protein